MLKKIGSGLAKGAAAGAKVLPVLLIDLVGLCAVGAISYGAWMVYPPAGFIAGGVLLLAGTLLVSRR
jgi:hypothetical protein